MNKFIFCQGVDAELDWGMQIFFEIFTIAPGASKSEEYFYDLCAGDTPVVLFDSGEVIRRSISNKFKNIYYTMLVSYNLSEKKIIRRRAIEVK